MPIIRPDIAALPVYEVGRSIEGLARNKGLDPASIVKLTSNESPEGPFPGVVDAVAAAVMRSNRYPDPDVYDLRHALAGELGTKPSNLLFGNGSTALLTCIANAVGGPGTSAVYSWPSFVMYRYVTRWAMAESVEVPLNDSFELDLEAMAAAITDDTTVVYLCNPNNPTGTICDAGAIEQFIESAPERVLIVIDEAYHHFVDDPRYRTVISLAVARPNVVVLRTFSKIYSLAAHRIGYAVGLPETLLELGKAQAPLTVNQVAQAAALASLGQPDELARRRETNASGRHHLLGVMAERGLRHTRSQTNFVFFNAGGDSRRTAEEFGDRGVIIRPLSGGWMRVTVGSASDNRRFVEVLDEVLAG